MALEKQAALHQHWKVGLQENTVLSQLELMVTVVVVGIGISAMANKRTGNACWRQELQEEEHAELENSIQALHIRMNSLSAQMLTTMDL
jgi:hypothetical protein